MRYSTLALALVSLSLSLPQNVLADRYLAVEAGYDPSAALIIANDGTCGTLMINSDETYENGYSWQYNGVLSPDYGAMAECFFGSPSKVCAVVVDLTESGHEKTGELADFYVWTDDNGAPGTVIGIAPAVDVGVIARWPALSRHTIPIEAECTEGTWWAGYWADWEGDYAAWFVGADLDGGNGCPRTNVVPGIGFPTGWQDVSITWGPTQALGIGVEVLDCEPPSPTLDTTWGQIKTLYR